MLFECSFECPRCRDAFHVDFEVDDSPAPKCGEGVLCICPNCRKVGSFEILCVWPKSEDMV